jgi:hypothetical protein
MHEIQKIMLKRLLDHNKRRFAELTQGYSFEDNVVFHLKQLISKGLIERRDEYYIITAAGVKTITHYDIPSLADVGFKTFFVGFLCSYSDSYLVKEHPNGQTNFYNLPSGKPHFGEPIEQAQVRLFEKISGITLPQTAFSFYSLHLKTVKTNIGEVLFDDAFAIYRVALAEAQHDSLKLTDNIQLLPASKIKKLPNRWPEVDICILQKDNTPYRAYDFASDYILQI